MRTPPSFAANPSRRVLARWGASVLAALAWVGACPGTAAAGGGAATDAYDDVGELPLELHGLVDLYDQGNFNRPPTATTQLRAFDGHAGEPALGMLRLTVAHKPDPFGVRIDLAVGDVADGYLRFDPAATAHPDLSRGLSYVEQAFVTAVVPVGRGLAVDAGKFGTPVGLEDNESLANWNYSRSLLYLLAEPSYHAGLRVTYPVAESVAVSVFWVNGWDATVLDGNGMRTLAAAVSFAPVAGLELVADCMGGPERAPTRLGDPASSFRSELDVYARYAVTKRLAFAWTADLGHDAAAHGATFWGVGGYARVGLFGPLATAVRAEHYSDDDGFTTGTRQQLAEVTGTLELRGPLDAVAWVARLEVRHDASDAAVFASGARGLAGHQDTLGVSAVAAF